MLSDKIWHFVCRPAVYDGTVALWCIRRTYWAELDFQRPKWETETEDDTKGAILNSQLKYKIIFSQTTDQYFHWNAKDTPSSLRD